MTIGIPLESDLPALFAHYGTDKRNNGYGHIYHTLLYLRRQMIDSVLEIGIGTMSAMHGYAAPHYKPGGSLRAWRDYFPKATILGLNTASEILFREDRIKTRLCDSTNEYSVCDALGDSTFDFIIDDGSHNPEHQLATLRHVYPHLRTDGIYVIEDIPLGSHLAHNPKQIYEIIGHQEFFFVGVGGYCCVIFNRPLSPYPRFGY